MNKNFLLFSSTILMLTLFFSCGKKNNDDKFSYKLLPVKSDEKWGYIDNEGKYLINPQFKDANLFSDGIAMVKSLDDKIGYINEDGKFAINPNYKYGTFFSEGLAFVTPINGFPTCIDKKGETKFILKEADLVNCFSEGLSSVRINGKYGFIDKLGKIVINPQFEFAGSFKDGLALIYKSTNETNENTFGYIDKTGKIIINYQFQFASNFSNGLAIVSDGKKYGYIDKKGLYTINPQFDDAMAFNEGLAAVKQSDSWGFIDINGKFVINPQFEEVNSFKNSLASVRSGKENWGYINKEGKFEINPQFKSAGNFNKKFAPVLSGDKIGFIDIKGKFTINPQFTSIYNYSEYLKYFYEGNIFYSVESDYYDVSNLIKTFFIETNENSFNSFNKGSTLGELVDNKKYNDNLKENTKYSVINNSEIELTKDVNIKKIIFDFNKAIYSMIPQYYYGYQISEDKKYNFNVKLKSMVYHLEIKRYSKADGKSQIIAEGLQNEIEKIYGSKVEKIEVSEGTNILNYDSLSFKITYSDEEILFEVVFLTD